MIIGTILLTHDNVYCLEDGSLPKRNSIDKVLLKDICSGSKVSSAGYALLPPSIREVVEIDENYDTAITIPELNTCDLLIVNRSEDTSSGKVFRMDHFQFIHKSSIGIELWASKQLKDKL